MKIKKVITCGCSFSDSTPDGNGNLQTWPFQLKNELDEQNIHLNYTHRGLPSQGQELIQKKTTLAIIEALKEYGPEEIAVIVMWSGTERKSFYVDNTDLIKHIADNWNKSKIFWHLQFADLKNELSEKEQIKDAGPNYFYNKKEGWYICAFGRDNNKLTDGYFYANNSNIAAVHISIENIIFLQNFCKAKGIKIFQQFYKSYSYLDIEQNQNHQIVGYLFNELDEKTIISKQGMHDFLIDHDPVNFLTEPQPGMGKYGTHPKNTGAIFYVKNKLIPRLNKLGFFDE